MPAPDRGGKGKYGETTRTRKRRDVLVLVEGVASISIDGVGRRRLLAKMEYWHDSRRDGTGGRLV
jgi:hypothetical protein